MPFIGRAAKVKASPMAGAKAMAKNFAAGRERGDLGLVRGELLREPLGGRTWRGALANRTDGLCLQVAVEIRFLDRSGATVGGLVRRADRLAPGSELDLQSRLPPEAAEVRLHTLRWTRAGEPAWH